jgi:hypothetical protein
MFTVLAVVFAAILSTFLTVSALLAVDQLAVARIPLVKVVQVAQ